MSYQVLTVQTHTLINFTIIFENCFEINNKLILYWMMVLILESCIYMHVYGKRKKNKLILNIPCLLLILDSVFVLSESNLSNLEQ